MLYSEPLQLIALVLIAALMVGGEVFFRIGRRAGTAPASVRSGVVSTMQSALLALLGLLLAFTFGMANSRFEQRKSLVVEDANDIGTTWLRTAFLPEPQRSESREILREYLSQRIALYDDMAKDAGGASLAALLAAASQQQDKLWTLATQAAASNPKSQMLALYVESLNATIDVNSSRVAAARNHVPEVTLVLLFVMSMGAACSIGHTAGMTGRRSFWSTAAFHVLVVLVIVSIMDIDRPRRGFIRISQTPLIELRDGLVRPAN